MTRALLVVALVLSSATDGRADGGDEERLARATTALVTAELAKGEGYEVVTERDLQGALELEVERQLAGCDEASCMNELAGALGARFVVMSQLDRVGAKWVVNLTVFDTADARVVGRAGVTSRGEDELAEALPPAAARLREAIGASDAVRVLVLEARLPPDSSPASPSSSSGTDDVGAAPPETGDPVSAWLPIAVLGAGGGLWALTYLATTVLYLSTWRVVLDSHQAIYPLHFVPVVGPAAAAALLGPAYGAPLAYASSVVQVAAVGVVVGGGVWWWLSPDPDE